MGLFVSRSKAIEYIGVAIPKSFKKRFRTLAIYYVIYILALFSDYFIFKNKYVLIDLGISFFLILIIMLFSIIKKDKVWYNKYLNLSILSIVLSFLFYYTGLTFFIFVVDSYLVYAIGILVWCVSIIILNIIELKKIKQKYSFIVRNNNFILLFCSIPGIVANLLYRLIKDLEYSYIIFSIIISICMIVISFSIMPASKDIIRYHFAKKYVIKFDEVDFSSAIN